MTSQGQDIASAIRQQIEQFGMSFTTVEVGTMRWKIITIDHDDAVLIIATLISATVISLASLF